MNKAYKYTLTANEHKEITFGVGVQRLAITNANGTEGDVIIVTSEITKTDSGEICSFVDGADAPFADLIVNIVATQSGSGDPSPDNVRPITGWTGAKIVDDSVYGGFIEWNQIFNPAAGSSATSNGIIFTKNSDGSWSVSGTATADAFRAYRVTTVIKGHKYLLKATPTTGSTSTYYSYIVATGVIGTKYDYGSGVIADATESGDINFVIYVKNGTTISNAVVFKPQLFDLTQMFGSTIADYIYSLEQATAGAGVEYFRKLFPRDYYDYNSGENTNVSAVNGDTDKYKLYNIDWEDEAGTVCGGQLNVKTGELTVTHANIASYNGETINEPWISSMDVYSAGATPTTGAQVVYPLTTLVTYQLTPTEVRSLLGVNNVWADCGAISLKYFVQSTQPLIDYINDEDDKCIYIDCTQTGLDTYSITSDITKSEFASLLNKNKNVKLRLDTGSADVIFDLSYVIANIADFTCNRTALISDANTFQSLSLRVDMSGDTLSLSRGGVISIGDGTYEYITGQNNQLIKDGWSWSTQGYDLRDADELLFMITPMPNVASDSDTINGELQRSPQDPKRALFCKGIKNMLPDVQEIESPIWFNDIVVVGNRATYTSKNDIIMKIRVWANYYSSPQHSLADVNFYANCDCNDSTANLWGMCNVFVFKKKR